MSPTKAEALEALDWMERAAIERMGLDVKARNILRAFLSSAPDAAPAGEPAAELIKRLRSLRVVLGIDSPETRGWAKGVQQEARRVIDAAIAALATPARGEADERALFDQWFGDAVNDARISAAASPYDTVMKLREALWNRRSALRSACGDQGNSERKGE